MRATLTLLAVFVLFNACKKSDDVNPTVPPTAVPPDTIRGILLSTRDIVGSGYVTYLTMFDTTGAIKWRKTHSDFGSTPYPAYANNMVYLPSPYFNPATSTGYFSLFGLDANNGNEVWKYQDPNSFMATPVIINDTVYAADYHRLMAFSRTGTLLWTKNIPNLAPLPPVHDGKTLYLISAAFSSGIYSIHALDIKTRNVLWTSVLGAGHPPIGMFVHKDMIHFINNNLHLTALNKNTGVMQWIKGDQQYYAIVHDDKNVYAFNNQSPEQLIAFDLATGVQAWKFPLAFSGRMSLYTLKNKVYFLTYYNNVKYMNCVNTTTGDTIWRKRAPMDGNFAYNFAVTDRDLIYFKTYDASLAKRIVRYDAETFVAKDSFVVQGLEVGAPKVVMTSGRSY